MADETVIPASEGRHERAEPVGDEPTPRRDRVEEVAARSADGSKGLTFRKVFVMGGQIPEGHPQHEANWLGVLQEALHRGLHPKGKVRLTNVEETEPDRRGAVSTVATYVVDVEPASTDREAHTTVAPSSDVVHEPVRS
jgi:hypothetical protein